MSVTKEEAELAYHDNTNESATQENTLPTPQVDSRQSLITGGTANHYSSSGSLPPGTSPCQLRPSGSAPTSFDPSHDTSHSSSGSLPPGTSPCQLRPSGSAPASFDPSHDTSHSSSGSLPPGTSPCQLRPSHC